MNVTGKAASAPQEFGGPGGCDTTIPFEDYKGNLFAEAVERSLGARIRAEYSVAKAMWSALANIGWKDAKGNTANFTFRAAGDLIASIRGEGNYMNWYCCGEYAKVTAEISDALAAEGWRVSDVN